MNRTLRGTTPDVQRVLRACTAFEGTTSDLAQVSPKWIYKCVAGPRPE